MYILFIIYKHDHLSYTIIGLWLFIKTSVCMPIITNWTIPWSHETKNSEKQNSVIESYFVRVSQRMIDRGVNFPEDYVKDMYLIKLLSIDAEYEESHSIKFL